MLNDQGTILSQVKDILLGTKNKKNCRACADDMRMEKWYDDIVPKWDWAEGRCFRNREKVPKQRILF